MTLLMMAACGFPRPPDLPGPASDAGVPADASLCFGSFVRVCFDTDADLPTQPQHWGEDGKDVMVDTDIGTECDQHNSQMAAYCVVTGAGMTFAENRTFRVFGDKPLVLLSTSSVELKGLIDVSGPTRGFRPDPRGQCGIGLPPGGISGGAGGSFAGQGGDGEAGTGPGGKAGPRLEQFPSTLRGGCSGQQGVSARGGKGGGAVAIIAPTLFLDGVINASGEGGLGGSLASPAGGGGSGGMIVVDVSTRGIVRGASGLLFANGGGGGEGGDPSLPGSSGVSPSAPTPAAPGGGTGGNAGPGNFYGGKGGSGSAGGTLNGSSAPGNAQINMSGGAAGGGGAAGFIHAPGIIGDSIISPPSTDLPGPA
jgi:hypothetical protein